MIAAAAVVKAADRRSGSCRQAAAESAEAAAVGVAAGPEAQAEAGREQEYEPFHRDLLSLWLCSIPPTPGFAGEESEVRGLLVFEQPDPAPLPQSRRGDRLTSRDARQLDRRRVRQCLVAQNAVDRLPGDLVVVQAAEDVDRRRFDAVAHHADGVQHPAVAVADPDRLAVAAVLVEMPGPQLARLRVEADAEAAGRIDLVAGLAAETGRG